MTDFVSDLQTYTGVEVEYINIREKWNANPPEEAHGAEFRDFLQEVCDI